jgi:hypothetical protein
MAAPGGFNKRESIKSSEKSVGALVDYNRSPVQIAQYLISLANCQGHSLWEQSVKRS